MGSDIKNRILPDQIKCPFCESKDYAIERYHWVCKTCGVAIPDNPSGTEMVGRILSSIGLELEGALEKFPSMNSAHEGYAVILEELDELWEEVKVKQGERDIARMKKEAVQVAAMAVRFILDICDGERGQV